MWLQWLYNVNCFFLIRNFAFVYYSFSAWSDFWKAGFVKRDIFVHHFYTSQILRVAHLTLKRNISISLLYSSHLFEHRKGSTKRNFTKKLQTQEKLEVVEKQNSLNTEQQKVGGIGKGTLNWDLLGISIYHWLIDRYNHLSDVLYFSLMRYIFS